NSAYPRAHNNLASALARSGRFHEAIEHYEEALQRTPDDAMAQFNLGSALAQTHRLPEAIEHYLVVVRLTPDDTEEWINLEEAYAETGRSDEAIGAARQALDLARSKGRAALVKQMEEWLSSHHA